MSDLEYQKAAPLCDIHKPDGGTRSGCLICSIIGLSHALSEIDYICGPENEYHVSDYDLHCDEKTAVDKVRQKIFNLTEQLRVATKRLTKIENAIACDYDVLTESRASEGWELGYEACERVIRNALKTG